MHEGLPLILSIIVLFYLCKKIKPTFLKEGSLWEKSARKYTCQLDGSLVKFSLIGDDWNYFAAHYPITVKLIKVPQS